MGFLGEFKTFAMRGNVVDMAIGIIIGGAFGPIVGSVVNDIMMPPLGTLLGGADFKDFYFVLKEGKAALPDGATLAQAKEVGAVVLGYGVLANAVINFLIVSLAVFLLVKAMNKMKAADVPPPPPNSRDCPFCCTSIPKAARRCPHCTSEVAPA